MNNTKSLKITEALENYNNNNPDNKIQDLKSLVTKLEALDIKVSYTSLRDYDGRTEQSAPNILLVIEGLCKILDIKTDELFNN